MTWPEMIRLGVAVILPLSVVPLKRWVEGNEGPMGLLSVFGSSTLLAAVAGMALGWGVPHWVRDGFEPVPTLGFVFLACWSGLVAGSSLDLRMSRKLTRTMISRDLVQGIAVLCVVAMLIWAISLFVDGSVAGAGPGGVSSRFHVLTLAAICLMGPILPQRQPHRGAGTGSGFWEPSLIAPIALLMAAVAVLSDSIPTVTLRLPGSFSTQLFELGGPIEQLLWATAAGAIAGLLMDLVSREDFAPGGLYVQMAAVTLVCSGLAAMAGFSPLWIGGVAGFWSASATLRRLDLLMVLERGVALPRVGAPVLAGWCVGVGVATVGLDWEHVAIVAAVIVSVRPGAHIMAAVAQRRRLSRTAGRRPRPIDPSIIEVGEVALVVAGVGALILPAQVLPSLLLGALLAQLLLGIGAQLWRYERDTNT